jgi:hypothetical protein
MPGLDPLFDEIAAFPEGKHDDQVDAMCTVAAHFPRVVEEARRSGCRTGRLVEPLIARAAPPPKSRDQQLFEQSRGAC